MYKTSKILTLFIAALILLMTAVPSFASEQTRTFDLEPGQKIEFDLKHGGSIDIAGWDKPTAEINISDRRDLSDYELTFDKTSYGLKITASLSAQRNKNNALSFTLNVPHKVDVDFFSGGGGFTLKNVEGQFKGKTYGGSIKLDDVKGNVAIKTNGGGIEVINSKVDGAIHTNGGSVLVRDVVGDLYASTNGGEVRYENVRRRNDRPDNTGHSGKGKDVKGETVHVKTNGGDIDVDEAPDGAIVYTGGGEININNADKFVEANTGGGDIDIRTKSGWIKATTGAGNIDVTIDQDTDGEGDITIFTGSGDVTVTVPKGFSMELDIDLGYTRYSFKNYRIISDFDFKIEKTDKWDYSQGSPRKHIYGTGKIEGGRHKIKIRSVNGSVEIKKK